MKKTIKISNINRRNERKKSSRRSCSLAQAWEGEQDQRKKIWKHVERKEIWIEQGFLLCCDEVTVVSVLYALVLVNKTNDVKLISLLRPWARAFSTVSPSSRFLCSGEARDRWRYRKGYYVRDCAAVPDGNGCILRAETAMSCCCAKSRFSTLRPRQICEKKVSLQSSSLFSCCYWMTPCMFAIEINERFEHSFCYSLYFFFLLLVPFSVTKNSLWCHSDSDPFPFSSLFIHNSLCD